MLDVHAPHEGIHGVRDFFLHLLTITVGLLIALSLEGCVEWSHHRHLRHEADANLVQEIRDNQKELSGARSAIAAERGNLLAILPFLQARSVNRPYEIHEVTLNYTFGTLRNSSWQTASSTGAVSFMEYAHVQRYATAYQIQSEFAAVQTQTLNDFVRLESYIAFNFDPSTMSPGDAKAAITDARSTLSHLLAMDQIGGALSEAYEEALKK